VAKKNKNSVAPSVSKTDLEGPIEGHPPHSLVGECPVTGEACAKECEADQCQTTVSEMLAEDAPVVESSSKESELAKHPKFAKFKSQGENR